MNQPFLDTVLKFVEVGSATVKKAMDENTVHAQAQKQASDLRPGALDRLLDAGLIKANQKEAADAMLGGHATTISLLTATIDKCVEKDAQIHALEARLAGKKSKDIGRGEGEKRGGDDGEYDSLTDPFVGRRTGEKKASDYALARGAG